MYGKRFHFSIGFVNKLVELTEGAISSNIFENVLILLEKQASNYYFSSSSEANLIRIFSSIYDRTFFFQEISSFPHHGEILIAISASSNYLTDIVVRNPEYLYQLFDQDYLSKILDYEFLKKEIEGVERFKSFNAKTNFLRQFKKRFILKIGLVDILGIDELVSITAQLSLLAKLINAELFNICYKEILNKYNIENVDQKYCLCSLGKLGGNELNYSSDVDLILFYDFNGTVTKTQKEYFEILSEAAQLFIKSASAITDHGYIYRIDFRLRPDGKFSPLCKTLSDYTKYYETRGEDWERQMLIKLNFICGDMLLFRQFEEFIHPYVYPSSFSHSIKDKIKQMKLNIERQNKEKENVKTFSGGIRDIEFAVQTLQLINGGRIKSLRNGNTLNAIAILTEQKLLKKKESVLLSKSYIFYRHIEHLLQLMNDTQTHIIPDNKEFLNKLVVFTKMKSIEDFQVHLRTYRKEVRIIYENILKTDKRGEILQSKIRFRNSVTAEKNILYLRSGIGLINKKEFDTRTIELFDLVEPNLLKHLKKTPAPDLTLNNFVKVIRSTKFPSIWYNEFTNEQFLKNFLRICNYSQKAIDIISTGGQNEEFFLSRKVFNKHSDDLSEYSATELILSLSVQFALGLISQNRVSHILTLFVSQKIKSLLDEINLPYNFFIGGLGSFGSGNMNFASDIDLIIVADDVEGHPDIQKDFQKFLTYAGQILKPFEIDFKLRPEGKKSPLVWGINNYALYMDKRARVWEFQSLLKLNFIYGDEKLFDEFSKALLNKTGELNPETVRKEIKQMYLSILSQTIHISDGGFDIKKGRGGLLTVDFILQSLCLVNNKIYNKCMSKSNYEIFSLLRKIKYEPDLASLKSNYLFLKETEIAIQNIFNKNSAILHASEESKFILSNFLKSKSTG
ncbi:MAG: [protein-PII] uridylyltransferase family protein, partial [Melioribacteraceae bacterium]